MKRAGAPVAVPCGRRGWGVAVAVVKERQPSKGWEGAEELAMVVVRVDGGWTVHCGRDGGGGGWTEVLGPLVACQVAGGRQWTKAPGDRQQERPTLCVHHTLHTHIHTQTHTDTHTHTP